MSREVARRFTWFCWVALGCSDYSRESPSSAQYPILDGTLSLPSGDSVVKISATHSVQIQNCTGAMIAPNLVLTARHCVADYYVMGKFTCDSNGDTVSGPGGDTGATIAPEKVVVQVGTQPDFKAKNAVGTRIFALQTTTICRNDIAIVLLDRNLSGLPILPIRLNRGVDRGEIVTGVGYGSYEVGTKAIQGVRHSRSGLAISKVGKSQFNPDGDDIPPRTFQIDGGGFCLGDSGGPAISEQGAAVGVFSKATAECESTDTASHFEETGPHTDDLFRPAFAAAGFDPILELAGTAGTAGTAGARSTAGVDNAGAAGETSQAAGAAGQATAMGSRGNVAGSSNPDISTGGIPSTVATQAGGDGGSSDDELVYEGPPPKGGGCVCQFPGAARPGIHWVFLTWGLLLLRRQVRFRRHCSH